MHSTNECTLATANHSHSDLFHHMTIVCFLFTLMQQNNLVIIKIQSMMQQNRRRVLYLIIKDFHED